MNKKILISFVGGNDITSENAAIEQLIKIKQPEKIYLFVTKEFETRIQEADLISKYKKLIKSPIVIFETGIENPSDQKEIYEKIKLDLSKIKAEINMNKDIGLINLASGTPDIKCVFSILLATEYFPAKRFHGIYAPNPKYDNKPCIDDLSFYKRKLSEKTINMLIDKSEYQALYDYIISDKIPKDIEISDEFIQLTEFTKNRFLCNFEKAKKIYEENDFNFTYKKPSNVYEKAVEVLYSVEKIIEQKDYFQATLKLGIIRENILRYINTKFLGDYEKIADKDKEKQNVYYLSKEKLEKNYPELVDFLISEQSKTKEEYNQKFRFGEINSHVDFLIFLYFEQKENIGLKTHFYKLEELKKHRNDLAHTLTVPKEKAQIWFEEIKRILVIISEYFELNFQEENIYNQINSELRKLIK